MAQEQKADIAALMATPEAQKAIAEAAQKAIAQLVPSAGVGEDTQRLFSEMALAIANMSNQGSGRVKPVAPEIMHKREVAARKCAELLGEVHGHLRKAKLTQDSRLEKEWSPEYRVTSKVYFNERLIEPYRKGNGRGASPVAQDIVWTGMPNEALRPLNTIAERLTTLYRESVGAAPHLKSISGPNGGQLAPDNRPYWMTPGGLVVKGDPPPKATTLGNDPRDELANVDNNDPNDPFVHVLGTLHPPARQGASDSIAITR